MNQVLTSSVFGRPAPVFYSGAALKEVHPYTGNCVSLCETLQPALLMKVREDQCKGPKSG